MNKHVSVLLQGAVGFAVRYGSLIPLVYAG